MTGTGPASLWACGDYGAVAGRVAGVAEALVEAADVRVGGLAGRQVVDLACGTGNAALIAARRGARVTGVDITPELLAVASERAVAEDLDVTWRQADAARTGLQPGADVVLSCLGLIFVPEPDVAVTEAIRLLRGQGVLALAAWEPREHDPMSEPLLPYLPDPLPSPSPLDWGREHELRRRLAPRCDDVQTARHEHPWWFGSVEEAVALVVDCSPLHAAVAAGLDEGDRARMRSGFAAAFGALAAADGSVSFSSPYLLATAVAR